MSTSRITKWSCSILVILSLVLLISACSIPTESKPVSYVGGEKVNLSSGIEMMNGEPMVSPSFLESADTGNTGVYFSDQVVVLMYHDVMANPDGSDAESALPIQQFKEQMALLKANGFQVISIAQYADFINNKGEVPNNAVLLTFDDGYESFYTEVFPVLKHYGYPAVNFVIVSDIDNPAKKGIPKMTWDQMREMQPFGMSFYNHTYDSHRYGVMRADGLTKPVLTRHQYLKEEDRVETDEEYHTRIKTDLEKAERRLAEELGNTRGIIAFPYGAYNDEVLDILHEVGVTLSFTVKEGINDRGQTNGFRINGAKAGESAVQLMEKLKALSQ